MKLKLVLLLVVLSGSATAMDVPDCRNKAEKTTVEFVKKNYESLYRNSVKVESVQLLSSETDSWPRTHLVWKIFVSAAYSGGGGTSQFIVGATHYPGLYEAKDCEIKGPMELFESFF